MNNVVTSDSSAVPLGAVVSEHRTRGSAFGVRLFTSVVLLAVFLIGLVNSFQPIFPGTTAYGNSGLIAVAVLGLITLASIISTFWMLGKRVVIYENGIGVGRGRGLRRYAWTDFKGLSAVARLYRLLYVIPAGREYHYTLFTNDVKAVVIPPYLSHMKQLGEALTAHVGRYDPYQRER